MAYGAFITGIGIEWGVLFGLLNLTYLQFVGLSILLLTIGIEAKYWGSKALDSNYILEGAILNAVGDISLAGAFSSAANALTTYANSLEQINMNSTNSFTTDSSSNDWNLIKVGRWMSELEYNKMIETGKVQMSPNGNTSYVAYPADITAFESQAKPGSIYIEYYVDASRVFPAGNSYWGQIPGPGSLYDNLFISKGMDPIIDMPNAFNIVIRGIK